MDNTESQASDDGAGALCRSIDGAGAPARAGEAGAEIGYEAASPWLQQPHWAETMLRRPPGAGDR